jgi:hypothetical protein
MSAPARASLLNRRIGYGAAAIACAVIWCLVNVAPGWAVVAFLTPQTEDVLWAVNLSLIASVAANLVYLAYDPVWFKAAGDMVTTAIGLVAALALWRVFPFDFSHYSFNWALVARIVLAIAIVGGILGVLAQLVIFVRAVLTRPSTPQPGGQARP